MTNTSITAAAHLARVYNRLVEAYGEPQNEPDYDPLGGLVGTILSQHTSDINSGRAYRQLIAKFPEWEMVRDAPTHEVADMIRCGGLANIKAPRIQDALHTLTEWQKADGKSGPLGQYLYDELRKREPVEGWHYLRRIAGVGPKTAACVMMFNMDQPVIPIDTHLHRTTRRLGLIGPKVNADQAHVIFVRATPPEWVYPLHVNLIQHGRTICHAQRPKCDRCPLYGDCAYVGSVDGQETALQS